jgi:hypothetical protein
VTASDLLGLDRRQLAKLLCEGHPIDPVALDDTEYRGVSLGLPAFVDKLTWKTFKKVFHRDPETGHLRGWNVRIQQTGLEPPFIAQQRNAQPFAWGHYRVVAATGRPMPRPVPQGLLIDYGLGRNSPLTFPVPAMRDPLVALEPGSVDLLLGWSYLELGPLRISTPSYFSLERDGPLTHRASP